MTKTMTVQGKEISCLIEQGKYAYYGIRGLRRDERYAIGDYARASKEWDMENDRESEENLSGTSAIEIKIDRIYDTCDEIEEEIASAIAMAIIYSEDRRIAVLACNRTDHGQDEGEIIMANAKVIYLA